MCLRRSRTRGLVHRNGGASQAPLVNAHVRPRKRQTTKTKSAVNRRGTQSPSQNCTYVTCGPTSCCRYKRRSAGREAHRAEETREGKSAALAFLGAHTHAQEREGERARREAADVHRVCVYVFLQGRANARHAPCRCCRAKLHDSEMAAQETPFPRLPPSENHRNTNTPTPTDAAHHCTHRAPNDPRSERSQRQTCQPASQTNKQTVPHLFSSKRPRNVRSRTEERSRPSRSQVQNTNKQTEEQDLSEPATDDFSNGTPLPHPRSQHRSLFRHPIRPLSQ